MLQKSTKIIAATGILFFILSVVILSVFARMVSVQKAEFIDLSIAQARAEDHFAGLSALIRTLDETRVEREGLFAHILKDEDVIGFLNLIESIGKEQNVEITKNALIKEKIDGTFEILIMKMDVEGSYDDVMQMLKILEHLPYQSSIVNFRIAKEDREEGTVWKSQYDVRVTKFLKI
jgi:hypothetical protein